MLGFTCSGSAERNYPQIEPAEEKVLLRFIDLYKTRGDLLEQLILDAKKKFQFSEESVRFWAPKLVEGRFGPLEPLLSEDLEEIMVNGIDQPIFVYDRKEGMLKTNLSVDSREYFVEIANRMLAPLGRRVNRANPREFGVLEFGDRVSIAIPPYSRESVISIRKYMVEPFTVLDLVDREMISREAMAFLWTIFESGNANIGVVGNTGSGKTTLLNALTRFIPKKSRMVLVEDIPEIRPLQEQIVSLLSNKDIKISMKDAIIDSLRLRPDRVIIGEVRRNQEVEALREACLAGHSMGTYFTYHAESSKWARRRLMSQGFPEYDLSAVSLFVVCKRFEHKGKIFRKVVEIGGKNKVFEMKGGKLKRVGDFESEYWDISFDNPWKEVLRRKKFLKNLDRKNDKEVFERLGEFSGL